MENNQALGTERIGKLLRKFAIPCILSLLISALYNIVDQIFIGNSSLGYLGNAATSVVFPITIISFAFAWCFGDGAVALMSIRQGQKDDKGVSKIIGNAIVANIAISIIFIILCFVFMDPLLGLFGASDASLPLAKSYFTIILTATTASVMGGVLSGIIRADGSPAFSMVVTVSGAVLNIILDPIFIFGLNLGIEGAAYATIIGRIISFLIGIYYVFFRAKTFKLSLDSFKFSFRVFWQFTKLGISTFITQMAIVVTALVGNIMLAKYGAESIYGADIPIAVMGITMKVFMIVINIVVGLVVGAQPILGFNYGAGKYARVRETFRIVVIGTIIIGAVATFIFQLFPDVVISIFGASDELYMEFARKMFRIFLMFIIFTLLIKAISIFFQAVGEPKRSTISSLMRDLVCFVPLCLILPQSFGIDGVLYAAPVADGIGIIVAGALAVRFYIKLGRMTTSAAAPESVAKSHPGIIITIAREHGSAGKEIGRLVAEELNIPYYYKDLIAIAAKESGLSEQYLNEINNRDDEGAMRDLYLSSKPAEYAIKAQQQAIHSIAKHGSCVIVGRAADYVLRGNKLLFRVFIFAPESYRIKKLKEMYGDDLAAAKKSIKKSDKNRASYYNTISGLTWGARENYDLCIDSSIGNTATAKIIAEYAKNLKQTRSTCPT
ncbi:MATE family efflux transporter [Candidatus Saccharibacteria bacterium]|nr:MATE family efflux transporter [Candidatus Saccharibacteria bacterium]